tara:strand:- start:1354 stop:2268 length:915 start_codon:yes stop_codon:yes gene_type:complete
MVAYTLASESEFRNWLATTSYSSSWTGDAASIRRLLEASTREIEAYCGNQGSFGPITATLEFDEGSGTLLDDPRDVLWNGLYPSRMSLPWLVSVTSATLYSGTDRSTSTALVENTDYVLTPYSGFPVGFASPFIGMKYKNAGSNTDPFSEVGQKVLSIVGTWGWQNNKTSDTTLNGAVTSTTTKTIVTTDASNLSAAQTILVNSETMYIESISSHTLTVERGVAGTTAATHANTDQVYVFTYPATLTQTCLDLSRLSWVDRVGGLQDEITIAGATFSSVQSERRTILHNIDSFATHSATAGVTF